MIINTKVKANIDIDIDTTEAFELLLKTLHMEWIMNDINSISIQKDSDDINKVFCCYNGKVLDERGDLFVALRNVAVNLFPNLEFRNDSYIYNR